MNKEKPECMTIAKKYGKEFFDGERKYGYGGYKYIPGRWNNVLDQIISFYQLNSQSRVIDAGAGKGFFLNDLKSKIKSDHLYGFDISEYAVEHCPKVKIIFCT